MCTIYIQHTRDSIQAQIRTAQDEQTNSNCIAEAGNYFMVVDLQEYCIELNLLTYRTAK